MFELVLIKFYLETDLLQLLLSQGLRQLLINILIFL